ncbi:hypothetical protein CAEBREN_06055 [Caenorhabditis brenneri]|uniref:F-box domain-containing protein n=1 Tax=Caenorhabditis brenneri TaxID=135651 RepID=G0NQQ1_CAEBE|nr:hypothetical protein CAEBREN_06055 [Caenorhabditis brenneri]
MGFSVVSFLALAFDTVLLCVSLFVPLYSFLQGLHGLLYGLYLLPFGLYRLMYELYGLYGMYGLLYGLYGSCGLYLLYRLLYELYGLLERAFLRASVIEEISEPSYPNLSHMPEVVMEEVLKKLDIKAMKTLFKNRSHPLKIENIGLDGPYPLQATDMTEKWKTTLSVGSENYIAWSKV